MRFSLYDHRSIHHGFRTWIATLCILSLFCSLMPRAWWSTLFFPIVDAEVIIESAVMQANTEFNAAPAIVFTSATTGYSFFIDGPTTQDLAYKKTTDGGLTWGSAVVIDTSKAWVNVAVWYDQWTPGDTSGTKIHIFAVEVTSGDAHYTYLDTNGDTLRGSLVAVIQQSTFASASSGPPSITKNTDGNLFATCNFSITAGGYISKSTDGGSNWSATPVTGDAWSSVSIDQVQLLPLKEGGDILAIKANTSSNNIQSRVYDEGTDAWDSAWTLIGGLTEDITYDQWFSAMVRKSTGDIHLVFANATNTVGNDIEFWSYSDASRGWTQKTNLVTNSSTTIAPSIMIDDELGEIYVAYAQGTLATSMNIFVTRSTDDGSTWQAQRRISTRTDDYKSIRTSGMGSNNLYVQWYNDDTFELKGMSIPLTLPTGYEATIDSTILDSTDEFNASPAVVFTDVNTGYAFYIDTTSQDLAYRKTTNGGTSWGSAVVLNTAKDWTNVAVWYDRWTPGNRTGTGINIGAVEDLTDDNWYVSLDTTDDVASTVVLTNTGTTFTEGTYGPPSIARGSGGALFSAVSLFNNVGGTTNGTVSKSTNDGRTWTNITPSGWTATLTNQVQLVPLKTDQDIMAIMADTANSIIKYRIYDEVADTWDSSWTTIGSITTSATYLQWFSAAVRSSSGDVLLAFQNAPSAAGNDMEFWHFNDSTRTWTQKTNIATDDANIVAASTMIDETTGTIYVSYTRKDPSFALTNGTAIVYVYSTDNGATWSAEQPALNLSVSGYRIVRGTMNNTSRLYAVWYDDTNNSLFGATIALLGARFRQSAYRFFANANSLDVGSPLASQDTVATLTTVGQAFRLRILLNDTNRDIAKNQEDLKLEYAQKGVGTCASPTGTYANVSNFSTIAWNDNASAKNGAAFTSNANDPGYDGTERNQSYVEGGAFTNSGAAIASEENGVWDFSLKDNGGYGNTYCLRIAKRDGTTLTGYDVYPEITTKGYFSISGSAYTDEGTTGMSAGRRVSVSLNGGAATGSGLTRSGGFYSATLTGATLTGGTIIAAYLDNATEDGVTVTLGSGSSMTGIHLYQDRLILRSDSGSVALTSAHLNIADNNGDSDITAIYTVGANTTLQVAPNKELFVWSGKTFTAGGRVTTHDFDVRGTANMGTSGLTLSGSFVASSGTFTTATGTTLLRGTAETLTLGSNTVKNLTLQSSSYTLGSALDINGTLTIGAGSSLDVSASNYAITLTGSLINKAGATGFVKRSGTVTLDGNDQTLSGSTFFHNLSKTVTAAKTLTFYKGYTTTVSGALTLRGTENNLLSLRSSTNGTAARLVLDGDSGTQVIDYLNVQDNDASGGATLTCLTTTEGCVNGGNTTNWFFGSATRRHFFFFLE